MPEVERIERLIKELEMIRSVLEVLVMVQAGEVINASEELNKINTDTYPKEAKWKNQS